MSHPDARPDGLDRKLLAAIDRLGTALRTARQSIATAVGLTPLQIQIIEVLGADTAPPRVGNIAADLNVSQPTVSESIDALVSKGLVERTLDPTDRRASLVRLTDAGTETGHTIAARMAPLRAATAAWDRTNRDTTLVLMLESIASLHRSGVITVDRSCLTCTHYDAGDDGAPAHCRLLDLELSPANHRVDCPEHQPLVLT